MIIIALIVPAIGGMVEVVLSVAAVTAGPLLAPPIWALFSKRLTGKASFWISAITLFINVVFKLVLPYTVNVKLNRAEEMMVGVGFPLLLLLLNELVQSTSIKESNDYKNYKAAKLSSKLKSRGRYRRSVCDQKQNHFGLRVIGFSLLFTAVMMFGLRHGNR
jgi:MFS family permease